MTARHTLAVVTQDLLDMTARHTLAVVTQDLLDMTAGESDAWVIV